MTRHSFRWSGLIFGALFLSIAGNWAVWQGDLLTGREVGYIASGLLIAVGVLGVLATFRKPPVPAPITPDETTPGSSDVEPTTVLEEDDS